MTNADFVDLLNGFILVTFTTFLVTGMATTTIRQIGLWLRGLPTPRLLPRDIILLSGLAWPFVLILMARVFGWTSFVFQQPWWIIVTGIPPVVGVGTYLWYELFVIGQPEDWKAVIRSLARRVFHRDR